MMAIDVGKGPWEVEQKYRVEDHERVRRQLESLGGNPRRVEHQIDRYWRHPCRDFGKTDEALRIRSIDDGTVLTYKGPRLAGPLKIRPEIEVSLDASTVTDWITILESLGFSLVAEVRKSREVWEVTWQGISQQVGLDAPHDLGYFVEIEQIVDQLDKRDQAIANIEGLARHLDLNSPERRSYLSMWLQRD